MLVVFKEVFVVFSSVFVADVVFKALTSVVNIPILLVLVDTLLWTVDNSLVRLVIF